MRYRHRPGKEAKAVRVAAARGARDGFTLVELMIVGALIGTLSLIIVPLLFGYTERMRRQQTLVDLSEMDAGIAVYVMDNNTLPMSLDEVGYGNFVDPWGHPYQYLNIMAGGPGVNGKQRKDHFMVPVNSDYDLFSMGPDGKSRPPFTAKASRDDIVRASNGNWIGPVSEF